MADSNNPIEASFEPIEAITPVSQLVTASTFNRNEEIDKLFLKALNLNENKIYHEPTCIICSSPYREDIEKNLSEKNSVKEAAKLFKEKTGESIGDNIVSNHLDFHMKRGERELVLQEYIHKIKRLSSPNLTTMEKISLAYAILSERIMGINSLIPTSEESAAKIEQIKSSETNKLMGTLNNLLKLQASILGEMKTSGELVYIPTNDFIATFESALRAAKTDREKELITGLLDKLEALARKTQ
jgi:hypothetical protein